VQGSTVAQGSLPAIGATGAPAPGLSGQPVLGGVAAQPATGFNTLPPVNGATTQTAMVNGQLAPIAQPGMVSAGPEGVWTALAGTSQCRLNLPLTLKEGANYYRASAPGCALPSLAAVAGWQQVGGMAVLMDGGEPEAETAQRFFLGLGIPQDRLVLENRARNTEENAEFSKSLLAGIEGPKLLVTSAFHMPRSMGLFRKAGIEVLPWPTDYRSSGVEGFGVDVTNPVDNLMTTTTAIREWVGLAVYHWTGKIDEMFPGP
jgi:hypothetical protein